MFTYTSKVAYLCFLSCYEMSCVFQAHQHLAVEVPVSGGDKECYHGCDEKC